MFAPALVVYMNTGSLGEELLFVCKQLVHVTLQSANTLDTQVGIHFLETQGFDDLQGVKIFSLEMKTVFLYNKVSASQKFVVRF